MLRILPHASVAEPVSTPTRTRQRGRFRILCVHRFSSDLTGLFAGPTLGRETTGWREMTEASAQRKVSLSSGEIVGPGVQCISRTIGNMKGIYRDEQSRASLVPETLVYRVQTFCPVEEGNEGGLFWGTTFVNPGMVGDEYFMTKGHHHAKRSRSEFYLTVAGAGALILMDESRNTVFEPMSAGTLHYVSAYTAHRIANTGNAVLSVLACWPSDAGHDYDSIARDGFSARLRNINGSPVLVAEP